MDDLHFVQDSSSYRDSSGFIFKYNNEVYRQVNLSFKKDFEKFIASGLYNSLVEDGLLIPHEVIDENFTEKKEWYTTLKPELIPFISYPYEWSFEMLKDAALLTLQLALKALDYGMVLKDASAFNVQFHKGRMIFIDTLSFEGYKDGEPWIAYRQFCEQLLGPLALMHYLGLPMQQLQLAYPDGIPLQYVKKLLPFKSRFNLNLYLHIHLHASYSNKNTAKEKKVLLSKSKLVNLLKNLQATITSLHFDSFENIWGKYYEEAGARPGYLEEKKQVIADLFTQLPQLNSVIDVGGNTGEFTALAIAENRRIICADGEHYAIDCLYKKVKKEESNIIPLLLDFTNPSPAIGVNNEERASFLSRSSSDLAMALALIHHLAIGKNISFELIVKMFLQLGTYLIIEFVPKDDEKVQLMLQQKRDTYQRYTEESFLASFSANYKVLEKRTLTSSARTIYLMQRL